MAIVPVPGSNPTQEELDDMIDVSLFISNVNKNHQLFHQDADADGSGSVDFGEFVGLMIKVTWMYYTEY